MIYLYTLPGINFSYPDIKNILYSTYLKNNNIKYKMYDYTDCFLNEILVSDNFKDLGFDIQKIKHDIKNDENNLLEANSKFIRAVNNYLEQFGINYNNNRGFSYNYAIRDLDDFIGASESICDFTKLFKLDKYNPKDIIFMNVSYGFQVPMALGISKRIKKSCKNVKIIWGGNYLTQINRNCYELINKFKVIDAIIYFNHIKTFGNIIKYFSLEKVKLFNTVTMEKEFPLFKNVQDNINDYYLDYSDIQLDKYLSRDRILPVLLNYGCYHHKCKFCAHYYHYGNYMKMNLRKSFEIIKKMYDNKMFDSIVFLDECLPTEVVLEFARFIISNNIKTKWIIETRVSSKYLVLENVKLIRNSGCKFISFGIESYNKRILREMDKGIDINIIKKVFKNFYCNNVVVSATFMVGYPKENYFEIFRTLNFINHFKYIDLFGLNVFSLVRNSLLCEGLDCDYNNINLTYRFKGDRKEKLESFVKKFSQRKKLRNLNNIKSCLLSRSDYLYLKREDFSINYRKV